MLQLCKEQKSTVVLKKKKNISIKYLNNIKKKKRY